MEGEITAPERVLVRAIRALRVDGRTVAPGEAAWLPLAAALSGLACGQLTVVGPAAASIRLVPTGTWVLPTSTTSNAPTTSAWMLRPGDEGSVPDHPRAAAAGARGYAAARPSVTALSLFARWFRGDA